jgi:release factor glutamine methyltransferase
VAQQIETPGNVSLLLLSHALNQPKTWLLTHPEYELTTDEYNTLQKAQSQLLQGVPLPHILGEWEFYGRSFIVSPDVLIPRPETEHLVERALELAKSHPHPLIADVGTGSGAIAISLAAGLPDATLIATDISRQALAIACRNAIRHAQPSIHFLQADLLQPLAAPFDLICANLPYIPTATVDQLKVTRWEPRLALDGGLYGLDLIERLLLQAKTRLAPQGTLLLEIESTLGQKSLDLAKSVFPAAEIHLHQDWAKKDRLVDIHLT